MKPVEKKAALCIVLALAFVFVLVSAVWAEEQGVIEGSVVNGTAGGPEIPAGIPVTLHVYQGEAESATLQTATTAAGQFRFEELATGANWSYLTEAVYRDVSYATQAPVGFEIGETVLNVPVMVYETTDDGSAITLDSGHMIIESFGTVLRVSELYLFGNSGDRTYVGRAGSNGQLTTLQVPLSDNMIGLAFPESAAPDRFVEAEDRLLDTQPVPPGTETSLVFFSYHVTVADGQAHLERSSAYPLAVLNVLLAQPGLSVQSEQLQAQGSDFFEGQQYDLYAATGLGPEAPLVMDLTADESELQSSSPSPGVGSTQPIEDNQALLRRLGFGLAALAVAGAGLYPWAIRPQVAARRTSPDLVATPQARSLLVELASLDEAYAAGQLDEIAYQQRRAELYAALRALWQ